MATFDLDPITREQARDLLGGTWPASALCELGRWMMPDALPGWTPALCRSTGEVLGYQRDGFGLYHLRDDVWEVLGPTHSPANGGMYFRSLTAALLWVANHPSPN